MSAPGHRSRSRKRAASRRAGYSVAKVDRLRVFLRGTMRLAGGCLNSLNPATTSLFYGVLCTSYESPAFRSHRGQQLP